MAKKQLLLFGILLLIVLPLAISQTYQQRRVIDLKVPFEVNGSTASLSALCNVSVAYPNSTHLIRNGSMTNLGNGEFNYTIGSSKSATLGDYAWTAFCCDGTNCAAGYGEFTVTPSGFAGNVGFYILILILSLGIILFGFYISDAPIVILGSFGLYFIGLYILFYGIVGMKDTVYTWAIGIIILMLAAYISIKSAYEIVID